jgi:hypothetical protein
VLHIATVHVGSPRWIEIQTRHLREHISVPYQTWTSLAGIDPSYGAYFDRVLEQWGPHPGKLNNLALEIAQEAEPSDLLMFLDGDAFPIADPMPLVLDGLARAPLVAVRRAENGGDQQPHPCFCVTTVGLWQDINGDWSAGYKWKLPDGRRVSDIGGNLLRVLELTQTPWVEILRTNPGRLDPLLFAVYGGIVYHHGAGFRRGGTVRGSMPKPLPVPSPPVPVPPRLLKRVYRLVDAIRVQVWRLRKRVPQKLESKQIFEKLQRGDPDWLARIS